MTLAPHSTTGRQLLWHMNLKEPKVRINQKVLIRGRSRKNLHMDGQVAVVGASRDTPTWDLRTKS